MTLGSNALPSWLFGAFNDLYVCYKEGSLDIVAFSEAIDLLDEVPEMVKHLWRKKSKTFQTSGLILIP